MRSPMTRLQKKTKRFIVDGFHLLGWEISRHGLVKSSAAQGGYLPCPPNRYLTLARWLDPEFQQRYEKIRSATGVTDDRCYMLEMFARHCAHLAGDFAECGVWRGGTAMLLADVLREERVSERRLHLFDTFQGMPKSANEDPSGHREGDFFTSLGEVKALLTPFANVVFHPGEIPDTFDPVADRQFALIHVDVDLYKSTRDCLEFFYPRLVPGGILVCDDYGFPLYEKSARLAVDEFFKDKLENAISLRSGQCFCIKQAAGGRMSGSSWNFATAVPR